MKYTPELLELCNEVEPTDSEQNNGIYRKYVSKHGVEYKNALKIYGCRDSFDLTEPCDFNRRFNINNIERLFKGFWYVGNIHVEDLIVEFNSNKTEPQCSFQLYTLCYNDKDLINLYTNTKNVVFMIVAKNDEIENIYHIGATINTCRNRIEAFSSTDPFEPIQGAITNWRVHNELLINKNNFTFQLYIRPCGNLNSYEIKKSILASYKLTFATLPNGNRK